MFKNRNNPNHLARSKGSAMTEETTPRTGKIRYGLAAWLLGLPLPIIIIALLWGGCTR
jgi:hypothetical protein